MLTSLTVERLKQVLRYEPDTGYFYSVDTNWRRRNGPVGCLYKIGYRYICIDRIRYRAHRLAWLYIHGEWPSGELDHINGKRDDNRIANLRIVNRVQNLANRSLAVASNKTGFAGVCATRHKTTWKASIVTDGRRIYLGSFKTKEEAAAAYAAAREKRARQVFATGQMAS